MTAFKEWFVEDPLINAIWALCVIAALFILFVTYTVVISI
jgi:hypothetical protein